MSNILIIKHGSLGDIAQASGAIQDISENHKNDQIFLLTTKPYFDLFKKNPFIHEVILDKRLPRYNLIYLYLFCVSSAISQITCVALIILSNGTYSYLP